MFRVLKKQGLDIESSELEQIESIKKLSVLGVAVAVKTLQLKRAFGAIVRRAKNRNGFQPRGNKLFGTVE